LNSPSAGYAAFSPAFHWDSSEGLYVGGQFWNGRAANLQEQAKGPFLNPKEMAMPSEWAVVTRLKPKYTQAFKTIYHLNLEQIGAYELAPANVDAHAGVVEVYDHMAKAIAAFEKSRFFNRFNSKFDFFLAGRTQLTATELKGLQLFRGKGKCDACHTSTMSIATNGTKFPPLFTDFTYDNIGLPRNLNIPNNPSPDLGLGGRADIAKSDPNAKQIGKHKVMGLRNIALTAPYGHNGVLRTLKEVVHFYNTRDTLGFVADNMNQNFGITGWPAPEVAKNVNKTELGNLGLTEQEEFAIVAFMRTLTDDYPQFGNDPNVPPGTPSPFANTPFPPLP
jgi:cytochrome c peroxidase